MELQDSTIRLSKMIETVIRRCIDPKWRFPGGPNLVALELDVQVLSKLWPYEGIADERIVDYAVYQIYRTRHTLEQRLAWQPHYMFTDYAVDKYRHQFMSEAGKSGINYYINRWLDEYELSRTDLVKMIEEPKPNSLKKYVYMESEEVTKRRFLNTEGGYLLCQRSTTGWAPQSDTCKKCDYQKQCEQATAKRLPELVRLRKESI